MPAYKDSRWNALFFISFLLIGVILLVNLLVAIFFNSYKTRLNERFVKCIGVRKRFLENRFKQLDTEGRGRLDKDHSVELILTLLSLD